MTSINTKLLREVWKQRGPMLSIASVVAVGVMTVLTMRGTYESLVAAQADYYHEVRFPDVWASLQRAPESLRREIEDIPGVAVAETRVSFVATLDVPSVDAPAFGQFVSVPERNRPSLSDLYIKTGRYISPGRRSEVVVSDKFAIANGYVPGDTLRAVINGRYRDLTIVGTAITAEFLYAVAPGSLYPDDQRYGIVWMSREALGPATDLDGAFNEVVLTYAPRADRDEVRAELDRLLKPYGGLGAYERKDQPSHAIMQSELDSNRTMGTMIPAMFLLVAAFLLNIVLGRMIATQRTEIAVLKAFGYTNVEVGGHYLLFAMVAVMAGAVAGIVLGIWTGGAMTQMYDQFFDFPSLRYTVRWSLVLIAGGISVVAAGVGAMGAVKKAVGLPPAEAMRPESPANFKAGFFERIGIGHLLPSAGRMILRNIERTPARSFFSAIGVAFSVAILVIGLFMFDGVDYMMDLQFRVAQREDVSVTFNRPVSESVRHDLEHLDGVTRVEVFRAVPVRFHAGQREREAAITGLQPDSQLRKIVTASGGTQPVPSQGVVMSSFLAEKLGLSTGDLVTVELLEGGRRTATVAVSGIVNDFLGVSAYMSLDALHDLARGGRSLSGAFLSVKPSERSALNARLKELPVVGGVASPASLLEAFQKQLAEGLMIGVGFILGFSSIIAIAVIYNGARVSLSERGRELASLRVLGFSKREVAVLLLGEQGLTTLIGIPLGWWFGYLMAAAVSAGLQSETYRIPLIIEPKTFALAAVITIASAVVSGALVSRRLNRMDLIEVLKTRE